jgi:hypothetical protein
MVVVCVFDVAVKWSVSVVVVVCVVSVVVAPAVVVVICSWHKVTRIVCSMNAS